MFRPGIWAAVLVLLGAPLAGIDSGNAIAVTADARASFAPVPSAPYDPLCDAAGALADGNPEETIRIIRELRTSKATDLPASRERRRACADELDVAIASSALTTLGYCRLLQALEEADAATEALALTAKRDVPTGCSAKAWIDAESNKAEGVPPSTEAIGKAWEDFVATTLTPLAGVSAFLLATWGALLIVARLLVFFPFRDPITSKEDRTGIAFAGVLAALFGPALFVHGVASAQPLGLVFGGVLSVVAALLLGRWLGALPKLALEVNGKADTGVEVGLLSAVLRDMGGDAGRGLEIPVGPDVTALEASVSELSKNTWIAVAQKVILFVTNIKPWRIDVHMESADLAFVRIGRNGREIASQRIAASDGRATDKADEGGCSDPERIAAQIAAVVIATMRPKYPADFEPGLYGATKWDGIARQYIASAWYKDRAHQKNGVELLRLARASDPANRSAEFSYWSLRYRYSVDEDDLRRYGDFLKGWISDFPAVSDRDLFGRSVVAYLAVWRNWTAIKAGSAARAARPTDVPDAESWWQLDPIALGSADVFRPETKWLTELVDRNRDSARRGERGSIDTDKRRAIAAIDLKLLRETTVPHGTKWDGAIPATTKSMTGSPYVAYAISCAASRMGLPLDKKLLTEAVADPTIADFARREDPELERVRTEDWFLEIVGLDPEPELMYAPFEQHRELLDVATRAELVVKTWTSKLDLDLVLFKRLQSAAELSLRAEAADADLSAPPSALSVITAIFLVPPPRPLGRDARMVAVRHVYERKTNPLCDKVMVDVDALLERLRDVGYCGSRNDLEAWLARVSVTPPPT